MSFLTRGEAIEAPKKTWRLLVLKGAWRRRLNGYAWVMFDDKGMTGVGASRDELRATLLGIAAGPALQPYHPDDQAMARVIAGEIMDL